MFISTYLKLSSKTYPKLKRNDLLINIDNGEHFYLTEQQIKNQVSSDIYWTVLRNANNNPNLKKNCNYDDILKKVESFMVESGIREFCASICKGDCCMGCFTSNNSCHKNEGRRLSCSFYLCHEMGSCLSQKNRRNIRILDSTTCNLMHKNSSKNWSPYFDINTDEVKKKVILPKIFVDYSFPTTLEINKIRGKIRKLEHSKF